MVSRKTFWSTRITTSVVVMTLMLWVTKLFWCFEIFSICCDEKFSYIDWGSAWARLTRYTTHATFSGNFFIRTIFAETFHAYLNLFCVHSLSINMFTQITDSTLNQTGETCPEANSNSLTALWKKLLMNFNSSELKIAFYRDFVPKCKHSNKCKVVSPFKSFPVARFLPSEACNRNLQLQ